MSWVTGKGGVRRWVGPISKEDDLEPDRPVYVAQPGDDVQDGRTLTGKCVDCGRPILSRSKRCKLCHAWRSGWGKGHTRESPDWAVSDVVDRLARNLEAVPDPYLISTPRHVCGDCGCLLGTPEETCPACLLWRERNASAATWTASVEPYRDRRIFSWRAA